MIKINNVMYRYDNKLYNPGDVIDGICADQRNINEIVLNTYSKLCNFDFTKGYTYMNPSNDDDSWSDSYYLYEVVPNGPIFVGNDTFSIDICNDEINKRFKTTQLSESDVQSIATEMAKKYVANKDNSSVIAHSCKVIKRIHIGGEHKNE